MPHPLHGAHGRAPGGAGGRRGCAGIPPASVAMGWLPQLRVLGHRVSASSPAPSLVLPAQAGAAPALPRAVPTERTQLSRRRSRDKTLGWMCAQPSKQLPDEKPWKF